MWTDGGGVRVCCVPLSDFYWLDTQKYNFHVPFKTLVITLRWIMKLHSVVNIKVRLNNLVLYKVCWRGLIH